MAEKRKKVSSVKYSNKKSASRGCAFLYHSYAKEVVQAAAKKENIALNKCLCLPNSSFIAIINNI